MTQVKKRHHTTPEMYLKHFSGDQPKGKVWVYDKLGTEPRDSLPSEIGHQRYFYAVKTPSGTIDNRLEDYLATIENKATPIYLEMLKGNMPSSPQERHDFSTFLSLMYFRTPTMRRVSAEMQAASIENMCYAHAVHGLDEAFDGMQKQNGTIYTREEREKLRQNFLNPGKFIISVPAERTLEILSLADRVTPMFEDMHWTLLYPEHGFFITSDNPVFRAADPKTIHPIGGDGGFINKTVRVSFPLSPKAALMMTWQRTPYKQLVLDREGVDLFNASRAYSAERFVYSHIKHKKLSKLVATHRDMKIQFRTNGFGPKKYSKVQVKPPARN